MKSDIKTYDDVVKMVDIFYEKVNKDELLSPVFNQTAKVDWDQHLPKMYRFWQTLIFGEALYKGNPFAAHIPLPISGDHFSRWLDLLHETLTELFDGPVADKTMDRARSISHIFKSKLQFIRHEIG